jgi:hypothetical protein
MGQLWRVLEWVGLFLGAAIVGLTIALLVVRRIVLARVRGSLGKNALLIATGARLGDANGEATRSVPGILILLSNGLYFHAWIGNREIFVPGPSISWIGVSETGAGRERHRIVVRFLNATGKEDGIGIRLFSPESWVEAIKTHLIKRS